MKYLVSFAATTFTGLESFGNIYHETDEPMTEAHCRKIESDIEAAHGFNAASIIAISKIDEG